jgi:two-component system response regulator FixJ
MMPSKQPTIFVVEDDEVVCKSLRWLFESVNLPVEIFNTATAYLSAYDPTRYGCLLIDIRLPDMSGLTLQEKLAQKNNPIPIIIITGHGDVTLAVRAMKTGAKDFILKPFDNGLLLEKIQEILLEYQEQYTSRQQFSDGFIKLTARERGVLELVVAGKLNKQIAAEFNLSLSTIEQHRAHIMQKMGVKSLAELIKMYVLFKQ